MLLADQVVRNVLRAVHKLADGGGPFWKAEEPVDQPSVEITGAEPETEESEVVSAGAKSER